MKEFLKKKVRVEFSNVFQKITKKNEFQLTLVLNPNPKENNKEILEKKEKGITEKISDRIPKSYKNQSSEIRNRTTKSQIITKRFAKVNFKRKKNV